MYELNMSLQTVPIMRPVVTGQQININATKCSLVLKILDETRTFNRQVIRYVNQTQVQNQRILSHDKDILRELIFKLTQEHFYTLQKLVEGLKSFAQANTELRNHISLMKESIDDLRNAAVKTHLMNNFEIFRRETFKLWEDLEHQFAVTQGILVVD